MVALLMVVVSGCGSQKLSINSEPESRKAAELQLELGTGYLEQERLDLAQHHLSRSLQLAPSLAQGHYAMALLHLRRGDEVESERQFLHALSKQKDYPEAQNGYAVLLCRQGKISEAAYYFQLAIDNPGYRTPEVARKNRQICGEGNHE